jgi:NHLM bacteriocin system ABC transporter ATP-binding protein
MKDLPSPAAMPRHARSMAEPALLQHGSASIFLHAPGIVGQGLLPVGSAQAPAVLPMIDVVGQHSALAMLSFDGASSDCPRDGSEIAPAAWFNGAAAMFQWWKARQADSDVDHILVRGENRGQAGTTLSASGLVMLRLRSGRLGILGMEGEYLEAGQLLAMPREMSLCVLEDCVLDVHGLGELDLPTRLQALRRLWQLSMSKAIAAARLQQAQARQRSTDFEQHEAHDMEQGVGALAGLVEGDTSWLAPAGSDAAPLLAVARMVGSAIGVVIEHGAATGGLSDAHLVADLAEANGVRSRQVTLAGQWWRNDNGPLLAFRAGSGEPLALLPDLWRRAYVCVDASGKRTRLDDATASGIKPFAFLFFRPLPRKKLTEIDLLRFGLRGYEREMIGVVILAGLIGALALVVPLASAWLMDAVIPAANKSLLLELGVGLFCVTVTVSLFSLVRALTVLRIQDKMDMAIQAAIWDRLLRMPTAFHRRYSVANLEQRARACQKIIRILSARTVASILAGSFSALNFLILFRFSATLSLLALALVVAASGAVVWFRRRAVKIAIDAPDSPRKLSTLVLQLIQGVGKLRTAGAEGRAFALWAREHALGEVPNAALGRLKVKQDVFFRAFEHMAVLILFGAAGFVLAEHGRDQLSAGEFVGFFAAFGGVFHGVLGLCSTLVGTVAVGAAYHKARPILETLPEVEDGKTAPGAVSGAIEVNHVSFAYPNGTQVLSGVSLTASPGDFIAIVGPSGSGKSTLMRLLLGLEKASGGSILFDDKDLADLNLRQLRRQFGVVLQDTRLLPGSILSNIVGDSGASAEQAWAMAEAAAVADDIRAMPMGMYSVIGDGASTLSAGQRQRILIARALMRRPPVLFLDEATSLLDGPAQSRIMANLARMRVTRVVIAHRLSALVEADQILVLDQGKVIEQGNFASLMAQQGLFCKMAGEQLDGHPLAT